MAGFIRRYLQDPGLEELLAIEGVVVIDGEPAGAITGVGSGVVCVVGEFEDGPVATPYEVMSGQDLFGTFGGFGFVYDGIPSNNPVARSRNADGAVSPEYWNGNGYLACFGKKFRRLVITRVDTKVGEVSFTRRAWLAGLARFAYQMTAGMTLIVKVDGGSAATVTWDAAIATLNSAGGTYPTTFVGGEKLTLVVDRGTQREIGPVEVVFTAADTTHAAVVARINAAVGYAIASVQAGNVTRLVGRVQGTGGKVEVQQIDTLVATATGLSVTSATGTGDVVDITSVTFAELQSRVDADTTAILTQGPSGELRISATTSIEVTGGTAVELLGFPVASVATTTSWASPGVIRAGTRVRNADGDEWVVQQTIDTDATEGPFVASVRPGRDDGTVPGAVPGAVDVIPFPLADGEWSVANLLAISPALTEAQLDAAYSAAFDSTLNPNTVGREVNILVSARQSNAIRNAGRQNAIQASQDGLRGRSFITRPPLGTSRASARSRAAQPGVGASADERVWYAFPGGAVYVPAIAQRGTSGGAGFSIDGIVDVGSDAWLASVCSQLPPEENPGQETNFAAQLLSVERGNADVQDMRIDDYRAFKAAGICALRFDEGKAIFQSGKTSVDPALYPNRQNISRRRTADFIQDSIAQRANRFSKKLATPLRRSLVVGEINGFLAGLRSEKIPENQRIDSYLVDPVSGNTPETLAAGLFRIIVKVRLLASMDVIVLMTEIGETVTVADTN